MSKLDAFVNNFPKLIWALVLGSLEWIIPRSWYAKDVSNDIVLITGAGSGLGRELSIEFARLGASLILWDIDDNGMKKTKEMVQEEHQKVNSPNLGEKFCMTYNVDISKKQTIQEAAAKVHRDLNPNGGQKGEKYVSILVNNAGIYYGLYMHELSDAQIEKMFDINILAHFWTVRAFLPKMIEHKRGHILEIASFGGIISSFKQVTYGATKYATVGFEEALGMELDYLGLGNYVRTTAVCPYFFKSNLIHGLDQKATGELMSSTYVAQEAVLALRCNHTRVFLPKTAYILWLIKTFANRPALSALALTLGLGEGLKQVRGSALTKQA